MVRHGGGGKLLDLGRQEERKGKKMTQISDIIVGKRCVYVCLSIYLYFHRKELISCVFSVCVCVCMATTVSVIEQKSGE